MNVLTHNALISLFAATVIALFPGRSISGTCTINDYKDHVEVECIGSTPRAAEAAPASVLTQRDGTGTGTGNTDATADLQSLPTPVLQTNGATVSKTRKNIEAIQKLKAARYEYTGPR